MSVKYTICIYRTVPAFTNQWNQVPAGWTSMVRGTFPTEQAACERAREILPHGAPFTVTPILDNSDDDREHDDHRDVRDVFPSDCPDRD